MGRIQNPLTHRESLYNLSFCTVGEGFPLPRMSKSYIMTNTDSRGRLSLHIKHYLSSSNTKELSIKSLFTAFLCDITIFYTAKILVNFGHYYKLSKIRNFILTIIRISDIIYVSDTPRKPHTD